MDDSFFLSMFLAAAVAALVASITTALGKWNERMRLKAIEHAVAELEALVTREMKRRAARERWAEPTEPSGFDIDGQLTAVLSGKPGEPVKPSRQPWWRKHYGSKAQ